jgi:two-component system copper resistance phosphate regulon response regulator CusR
MKEQSATRDGKELNLSSRELKLLIFFMKNRETALSRIAIAQAVWTIDLDMNSNTVDVYINYLRNKVDKNFATPLIHTIKGTGYMLKQKSHES